MKMLMILRNSIVFWNVKQRWLFKFETSKNYNIFFPIFLVCIKKKIENIWKNVRNAHNPTLEVLNIENLKKSK